MRNKTGLFRTILGFTSVLLLLTCTTNSFAKNKLNLSMPFLIKNGITTVPKDLENITMYPFRNAGKTAFFSAGIVALMAVDKATTGFVQKNMNPFLKWTPKTLINTSITRGTDGYLVLGLGGLYLGSALFGNMHGQTAGILSLKAATYSILFNQLILKSIFARMRPDPNLDHPGLHGSNYSTSPWKFWNFHRPYLKPRTYGTSFPSFHFTLYFAIAKVLQQVYHCYAIPYAIAAAGLLPGFKNHHHWVSDMVAGAIIGTIIGKITVDSYFSSNSFLQQMDLAGNSGSHLLVMPAAGDGAYGVSMQYTL